MNNPYRHEDLLIGLVVGVALGIILTYAITFLSGGG